MLAAKAGRLGDTSKREKVTRSLHEQQKNRIRMRFPSVEHRGIEPAPGASCEKSREALFLCEKRGKWLNRAAFRCFRFAAFSCIFVGRGGTSAAKRLHKGYTEIAQEIQIAGDFALVGIGERLDVNLLRRLHI